MPSFKQSLCHLRWGYPNISLTRNELRTCCKTPFQSVNEKDMEEQGIDLFLNNRYQIERRFEMFKGIRHRDCQQCWQLEDQGANSLRGNSPQGFLDYANHHNMFAEFPDKHMNYVTRHVNLNSEILRSHKPFMLEVSLGNTCDLKCMYCNHVYSSQWATESLKNNRLPIEIYNEVSGKPNQKFIDLFWEWFNKEAKFSLERIGIIGGEPLITPDFYPFIDRLLESYQDIENDDTTIWIVTNLNTSESYFKKLMNYLPKLNEKFKLEILISMESTENQAEYIRNGLNWSKFENNVYKLCEATKDNHRVVIGFLPSVNVLSIPRYTKFLQWVYKVVQDTGKYIMLKQNTVVWPEVHTPFILTPEYAKYITEAIDWIKTVDSTMPDFDDIFGRWPAYTEFLINLRDSLSNNKPDQEMQKRFHEWFKDFDGLRALNFEETFPELKDFYNMCGKL